MIRGIKQCEAVQQCDVERFLLSFLLFVSWTGFLEVIE